MKIKVRLLSALIALSVALLTILGALASSVVSYQGSLRSIADDRVAPLRQLFLISRNLTQIDAEASTLAGGNDAIDRSLERITGFNGEISKQWSLYQATYLTPEEAVMAAHTDAALLSTQKSIARFIDLAAKKDRPAASLERAAGLKPQIEVCQKLIGDLVDLQQRVSLQLINDASYRNEVSVLITAAAALLAVGSIVYAFYIVRRFILSPFGEAKTVMSDLTDGSPDVALTQDDADEMDAFLDEVRKLRDRFTGIAEERRSAQQRVEEFRAQLEAVFRYSPFGIFIKDTEGRFMILNDAEANLWGRPKEEFIGRPPHEFLPPGDVARVLQSDREVLENGEPISIEYRGDSSTSYEWLQTVKFPVRNQNGEIFAIAAFDIDISEAKRRTQEVESISYQLGRSSRMAGLFHWFWHFNAATGKATISYDKESIREATGMEEILADYDLYLEKHVHPDDQPRIAPVFRAFAERSIDSYEIEYRFRCRNDAWMSLKVWAERVVDDKTGDVDVYIATQNITEIKKREIDLMDAKMHAEVADRAKTDFLANMSHELRTPLNPILGFSELLQKKFEKLGDKDTAEYLGLINEGGRHLLATINIILEFAQLDVVDTPLDEFILSPREVIETCIRSARDTMENGAEIVTILDDERYCILAEERAVRRALSNILLNALQAMPDGGVATIHVHLRQSGELVISVTDTGPGIDPQLLPEVGKAFVRGGSALRQRHGGIGLGLTIAQKLMALHGGSLEMQNLDTGGAKVSLVFPASRVADVSSTQIAEGALKEAGR